MSWEFTADRRDILFLLPPAHGHVTPNLPVLTELVRRGWRVRALVADGFAAAVGRTGATPLAYDPPLLPLPSLIGMTNEKWAKQSFDQFLGVIKASAAIEKLVARDRPDVVAFDPALWTPARVASAKWNIPAVQLVPNFITKEPFTPENMRIGAPDEQAERERLMSFGADLVQLLDEHGLPGTSVRDFEARPNEHTIVHLPKEFHPDAARFGDRYTFAGPGLPEPAANPSWLPPAHKPPVLLASLGSAASDRLDLFTACVEAFADSPWHLVVTLGGRAEPSRLGPLPATVEAHEWMPHSEVLAHADAYVGNAGMGSLMQALASAVPIVATPTPGHAEALGNSQRLAELGLGRMIEAEAVSAAAIRAAVDEVVNDPEVRIRLDWMQESIKRAGGPKAAVDAIEESYEHHE